jgi:GNAT superfamily N-acetyltransferase
MDDLQITTHDVLPPEAAAVDDGIGRYNDGAAPLHEVQPLACIARLPDGRVAGGAVGRRWGPCCELQQLWVDDGARRRGVGTRLMRAFEALAAERGCRSVFLETYDFQAPDFYRRLGYWSEHVRGGYPHGIVRYDMVRHLEPAAGIPIVEGPVPGCIGRITQLHAAYYARHAGFGTAFEATVARELAAFCEAFVPGRDGLWTVGSPQIEAALALDGSQAATQGAHLRWFIVSDTLRGQGVGRALLARALAFADARGHASTCLWTFAGLAAARHLYEDAGFRLDREGPGDRWGRTVTEQRFVRPAGAPTRAA